MCVNENAFSCNMKIFIVANETMFAYSTFQSFCNPSLFLSPSPRLCPFHATAHRPCCVPPSSFWPAVARVGGGREWRKRGREVLLPVRSLVQQPVDGPAALRGQETPQERSQGTPAGAASRQSGCHREHRSASWLWIQHKLRAGEVLWLSERKDDKGEIRICGSEGHLWNVSVCISHILHWGKAHQ